jgi:hypothetical protein
MATKHTPGPWKVVPYEHDETDKEIHTYNGEVVLAANMDYGDCWIDAKDEDLHLIAAAPDLLDVCKIVLASRLTTNLPYVSRNERITNTVTDMLKIAIAKAKGEV